MEKYKCNSCGNQFDGDDFMLECPSCSSNNISPYNSESEGFNIKNFFQENMRVSIILGLVILIISIIVLRSCGGGEKDAAEGENLELRLKIEKEDNFIIIRLIDKNAKKGNKKLDYDNNSTLYSSAGFEAYQNSNKIVISKGKIYPCNSGTIKLIWKDGFGGINQNSKIIKFELKNNAQSHEEALCKEVLELSVAILEDCIIKVSNNYDSLYPSDKILISINGKNGSYKDKAEWKLNKNNKTFEVWGFVVGQNDTIQPIMNSEGTAKGCNPFNADAFELATKKYASNPRDINALNAFKKRLQSGVVLKYEGVVQKGGVIALSNKLSTEYRNSGSTFSANIQWANNKKKVKSINFVKK